MKIPFFKYQGTGNDFILLDQRQKRYLSHADRELIERLCRRRFGIGADGLILLESHPQLDFQMVYFNADGRQSTMCGNGGRCIAAFARFLGMVEERCRFQAVDGPHEARLPRPDYVELRMNDVGRVELRPEACILDTGSPHYVRFVEGLEGVDVVSEGRRIRRSEPWRREGINVNFVVEGKAGLEVATYERGVEDETLSCGTGVTAAAIAWARKHGLAGPQRVCVRTRGGELEVRFTAGESGFTDVWLCGPVRMVFRGEVWV